MFAHKMEDGRYAWHYQEDDVFLMHAYARLIEQQVRANVGWYLTQVNTIQLYTFAV
jgi:hypothetical protein